VVKNQGRAASLQDWAISTLRMPELQRFVEAVKGGLAAAEQKMPQ
jgi:hypothetical protein